MNKRQFRDFSVETIGKLLSRHGFALDDSYSRPRGIVTVFKRNEDLFLLAWEEDELVANLVLNVSKSRWIRISINQFLWFAGDHDLRDARGLEAKMEVLQDKSKCRWLELLRQHLTDYDPQCMFEMDREEFDVYLHSNLRA